MMASPHNIGCRILPLIEMSKDDSSLYSVLDHLWLCAGRNEFPVSDEYLSISFHMVRVIPLVVGYLIGFILMLAFYGK